MFSIKNIFSRNVNNVDINQQNNDRRLAALLRGDLGASGVNYNILTAYKDIDIVNRSVNIIADACVRAPLIVKPSRAGNREDNRFASILSEILTKNPNLYEDRYDLLKKAMMDYLLYGNAYLYIAQKNLYVLNASNVNIKILPSKKVGELNKEYEEVNKDKNGNKTKTVYKQNEIIHIQQNDPFNRYQGQSRIYSVIGAINLYKQLDKFQKFFFDNNAVPGLTIILGEDTNDKKLKKTYEDLKEAYGSASSSARNLLVLPPGSKIDKFSEINFKNLDFEASKIRLEKHICDVIGVPHSIIFGSENENTKANQERFYKFTVLPILEQLCSAFEHYYGGLITVRVDRFAIEALREDTDKRTNRVRSLVATGIMSVNDARRAEGLEPIEDEYANKPFIPQNITGSAVDPRLGGRPPAGEEPVVPEEDNV